MPVRWFTSRRLRFPRSRLSSGPTEKTTRSIRTCSATSSRSTSTRSRWVPTTPRRTSPATYPATPSSPSSSTPPGRSARWPSGPDGGVWRLLQDDPDRYIYPAVGHGIMWNAREAEAPTRSDAPFDLPDEIAAGVGDASKRRAGTAPRPPTTPCPRRPGARWLPAANATPRSATS